MTKNAALNERSDQSDVIAFLLRPQSYGLPDEARVKQISTHISHIFLAGRRAYKLKRAVTLPYVDFSSLAARKTACDNEVTLNRRTAPELYLGVVAVTRSADGRLMLGGAGTPVDWLVEMVAFDQTRTLDQVVVRSALEPAVLRALGDTIAAFHDSARVSLSSGGSGAIAKIIAANEQAFAACPPHALPSDAVSEVSRGCYGALDRVAQLLDRRRALGEVRRCHGDLHLGNVCLIDGRPVLFDCLEFDETLATTDVLYDIAFLLMDLVKYGLRADANLVFNRYLDRRPQTEGLAAMPLFMALRAAVRAHVTALKGDEVAGEYVALALALLLPKAPRLVAIGGLSGSGKSTVAYNLAPEIGVSPGARVVRSDVIRKRVFGVQPETRLPESAYGAEVTERVYDAMAREAAGALAAGRSVIVDAVFLRPDERAAIAKVAADAAVPFSGLWLTAPAAVLEGRISGRTNDASDADASVLRRQTEFDPGVVAWRQVDVSGPVDLAVAAARAAVA